jgi:acetyl esterase/lipase
MKAKQSFFWFVLFFLIFPVYGSAASQPADTIALWEGVKMPHGKDVQLYAFRPENPNGISVVVCPGGSYHWLDQEVEGFKVGEWLSANGITAFVLLYRTAGKVEVAMPVRLVFRGKRHPDMITDAQRALQYVGEHASEYDVDPEKIGMMGFSAGGHLVMSAACFNETDFLQLAGIETNVNLRPAFVVPVYPVVTMDPPYVHRRSRRGLLGDNRVANQSMRDSLSLEKHIPDNCPPVFLINCVDDPIVQYQNSELLDAALTQKNVRHRYIQYETGGHGFGASDEKGSPECRQWRAEFMDWLRALYPSSL